MKKRLMMGLLAGGVMAAMLPGVASAGETEAACIKVASKPLGMTTAEIAARFDTVTVGSKGDEQTAADYVPDRGDLDFESDATDDLVCGFDGEDTIDALGVGDVFIGGKGDDYVVRNMGTVHGGDGNDWVTENHGHYDGGKNKSYGDLLDYGGGTCVDVEKVGFGSCPAP